MNLSFKEDTSSECLRSKIFSILSFWETDLVKSYRIKKLLMSSEYLSRDDIPANSKRLKVFRDFLCGSSKALIMDKIRTLRQGALGYFARVQGGMGSSRKGDGLWLGSVCGVYVEIHMREGKVSKRNECIKIVLSSLSNSVGVGKALKLLMEEFKLSPPSEPRQSNVYLSSSGRIAVTSAKIGVPILLSREVKYDVIEGMDSLPWSLEVANNNIRLKVEDTQGTTVHSYTILSDTFYGREWIPGTDLQDVDTVINKWASGESCPVQLIDETIGNTIPTRRKDFGLFIKSLHTQVNSYDWDITSLRRSILSWFGLKARKPTTGKTEPPLETLEPSNILKLVDSVNPFDSDSDDYDDSPFDWAEDVERENAEEFTADLSDGEDEQLNEMVKMFGEFSHMKDVLDDNQEDTFDMPPGNMFFNTFDQVCRSTTGTNFSELCSKTDQNLVTGLVGKMLSLVKLEYRIGLNSRSLADFFSWEDASSHMSESITNAEDVDRMDLDQINKLLQDLGKTIESSPPNVRSALTKTYNMYLRVKDLKNYGEEQHEETMDYDSTMGSICRALGDRDDFPIKPNTSVKDEVISQTFSAMVQSSVRSDSKVTEQERLMVLSCCNKRRVNSQLLAYISEIYEIRIITKWNSFGHKPTSRVIDLSA
jgi:hypothetical protein